MSVGCSFEATLTDLNAVIEDINEYNREDPDFINGEVVTSTNGYKATGVLAETAEAAVSSNGYQMEGAFYVQ